MGRSWDVFPHTTPILFVLPGAVDRFTALEHNKIIFLLFFDNHRSKRDYLFFLFTLLASRVERPLRTNCTTNLLLFGHTSHHVRTLMITLHVEVAVPYPHFYFFYFLGGDAYIFYSALLVIQGGLRFVILLWIPCFDYREGECYAQLCLAWIPGNPSLWISMPPVSLYYSDVRFTTWTYPSHSLADIWFNACSIASHTALCFTHILIILK